MTVRIVIQGGDSWVNRGDDAILAGTIQLIRAEFQSPNISVMTDLPTVTSDHHPDVIPVYRRNVWAVYRALRQADIVLWGGGQLIQNQSSQLFLLFQLFLVTLAMLLRKPVICFAQGVGQIRGLLPRLGVRTITNRLAAITVRDPKSRQRLLDLGVNREIHVLADPALILQAADKKRIAALLKNETVQKPYAIIAPRRWFHYRHGFLPVAWQPSEPDSQFLAVQDVLASIADWLVENHDLNILFVPMYPGYGQDDEKIADAIKHRMQHAERAKILAGDYRPEEFKGVFANAELVIGIRLHSTILATSEGVPAMTLYYQQKGREYFHLLDMSDFALPISDIQWEEVSTPLKRLVEERDVIQRHLNKKTADLQLLARRNIDIVCRVLEKHFPSRYI